jgi:hypothetical protein
MSEEMTRLAIKIGEAAATHATREAQIEFLNGAFRLVRETIDTYQSVPKRQRDILFGDFAVAFALRWCESTGRA